MLPVNQPQPGVVQTHQGIAQSMAGALPNVVFDGNVDIEAQRTTIADQINPLPHLQKLLVGFHLSVRLRIAHHCVGLARARLALVSQQTQLRGVTAP